MWWYVCVSCVSVFGKKHTYCNCHVEKIVEKYEEECLNVSKDQEGWVSVLPDCDEIENPGNKGRTHRAVRRWKVNHSCLVEKNNSNGIPLLLFR